MPVQLLHGPNTVDQQEFEQCLPRGLNAVKRWKTNTQNPQTSKCDRHKAKQAKEARAFHSENEVHGPQVIDS